MKDLELNRGRYHQDSNFKHLLLFFDCLTAIMIALIVVGCWILIFAPNIGAPTVLISLFGFNIVVSIYVATFTTWLVVLMRRLSMGSSTYQNEKWTVLKTLGVLIGAYLISAARNLTAFLVTTNNQS